MLLRLWMLLKRQQECERELTHTCRETSKRIWGRETTKSNYVNSFYVLAINGYVDRMCETKKGKNFTQETKIQRRLSIVMLARCHSMSYHGKSTMSSHQANLHPSHCEYGNRIWMREDVSFIRLSECFAFACCFLIKTIPELWCSGGWSRLKLN